jgi:hypothetical protein
MTFDQAGTVFLRGTSPWFLWRNIAAGFSMGMPCSGFAPSSARSVLASAHLIERDGEDDQVHLLEAYPPKLAVSTLVNSLKGVSCRLRRKERPDIRDRY